tara:strand:+ start:1897 stop:2025 length:129 start_codon:yes stop_codon:yes gene_type:complete
MGRKFESCRAHQKNKIKILNGMCGAVCVVVKTHGGVIAALEA